jgi:hypothetical protein
VIVTELALIAEVRDALKILRGQLLCIAIHSLCVEPVDQIVERGTEVVTTPAPVADVRDALKLGLQLGTVPK